MLQREVRPLVLLLAHALAVGTVVGLGVGQLGDGHGNVLVREFVLAPSVVNKVLKAAVNLNLKGKGTLHKHPE